MVVFEGSWEDTRDVFKGVEEGTRDDCGENVSRIEIKEGEEMCVVFEEAGCMWWIRRRSIS